MSLEHLQPWDSAEYAGLNRLIAQMNKGLFRSGSAFVDVNGANVSIPGGQVSGLTAAQISGIPGAAHVIGSYVGNGSYDKDATQKVTLAFTPSAVLMCSSTTFDNAYLCGFITKSQGTSGASIVSGGFQVTGARTSGPNLSGQVYRYLAFR